MAASLVAGVVDYSMFREKRPNASRDDTANFGEPRAGGVRRVYSAGGHDGEGGKATTRLVLRGSLVVGTDPLPRGGFPRVLGSGGVPRYLRGIAQAPPGRRPRDEKGAGLRYAPPRQRGRFVFGR
jgi:hypothetical protein